MWRLRRGLTRTAVQHEALPQIHHRADRNRQQPQQHHGDHQPPRNDAKLFAETASFALAAKAVQPHSLTERLTHAILIVGHTLLDSPAKKLYAPPKNLTPPPPAVEFPPRTFRQQN